MATTNQTPPNPAVGGSAKVASAEAPATKAKTAKTSPAKSKSKAQQGAAELERVIFGDTPAPPSPFAKRAKPKPATSPTAQKAAAPVHPVAAKNTKDNPRPAASELEIIGDLPDFIDTYVECHDVIELPKDVHRAIAIGLIGAILNDKEVRIPNGAITHSMDVWQAILSGSGGGRSTSFGFAEKLFEAGGESWKGLVQKIDWASPQAMKQCFAENQSAFYMWGEFGEKMKKLKTSQFSGMIQWWTDRYDSLSIPDKVFHRKRDYQDQIDQADKKTQVTITANMPDIPFTFAPRTNFMASSSYEWFYKNLAQEDSFGGFLPRWMLWDIKGASRSIPHPQPIREHLKPDLVRFLKKVEQQIKQGSQADLSAVHQQYADWYSATEQRFKRQPNAPLAEAFWNRHKVHLLKLAVIYEASISCSLKVSLEAWARAEATAKMLEETLFRMLQTGMDKEGFEFAKLLAKVEEKGEDGMLWSAFANHFWRIRTLREDVVQLNEAGKLCCFGKKTSGRNAVVLVHPTHVEAYQKKFPDTKLKSLRDA